MNTTLLFITDNEQESIAEWFEISTALLTQDLCDRIFAKNYGFSEYHSINDEDFDFEGKNEIKKLNEFLN